MIVSGTKSFDLRRTYGWALLLEAFLLWISYMVSNRATAKTGWWWSEYFAAIACGMQNAVSCNKIVLILCSFAQVIAEQL
jgi:hypothetical protein